MTENKVRKFAKEARARLLQNSYDKPQKKTPSNRVFKISSTPADDHFYAQVVEIANDNSIVIDPIGRLMDHQLATTMNETERLKYVFKLSNKYIDMMERYRNESLKNSLPMAAIIKD